MLRCLCYTPKTALSGGQQQLLVARLSPTAAAGGEDDLTLQQDSAEGAAATDSMHSELTLRQSGSLGSLEGEGRCRACWGAQGPWSVAWSAHHSC
jgi:hypothetical protein